MSRTGRVALLFSICGFYFRIPHGFFSLGPQVCILGRGGGGGGVCREGRRGMHAHFLKSTVQKIHTSLISESH